MPGRYTEKFHRNTIENKYFVLETFRLVYFSIVERLFFFFFHLPFPARCQPIPVVYIYLTWTNVCKIHLNFSSENCVVVQVAAFGQIFSEFIQFINTLAWFILAKSVTCAHNTNGKSTHIINYNTKPDIDPKWLKFREDSKDREEKIRNK